MRAALALGAAAVQVGTTYLLCPEATTHAVLGNIALRSGRKITWDPQKEVIVGDTEAARMVSRPYREPWRLSGA